MTAHWTDKLTSEQRAALATARANAHNGNHPRLLARWAVAIVRASALTAQQQEDAIVEACVAIQRGGLRGDISDAFRECGYTNAQFHHELCN
jgi:hypothetical protein